MIRLALGGVISAGALMLLYLSAEGLGVSIWYGLGAAAFSAVLIASGIADLRDRRDDWP